MSLAGGGLPSDLDAQVHTADSMVQIAFGGGNHCKRVIADGVFFTFLGGWVRGGERAALHAGRCGRCSSLRGLAAPSISSMHSA